MFYLFLIFINLLNSSLMLFSFHPLAMGLILLIQTLLICLITGIYLNTFWFSYILFLIFLGGMLVLFIYITSLASNEMFKFSKKIFLFLSSITMVYLMLMFFTDKMIFQNNFSNFDILSFNSTQMNNLYQENSLMLNMLFNYPINLITILLMIYLFLTLIVTVKITNIFEGPLRPKFN